MSPLPVRRQELTKPRLGALAAEEAQRGEREEPGDAWLRDGAVVDRDGHGTQKHPLTLRGQILKPRAAEVIVCATSEPRFTIAGEELHPVPGQRLVERGAGQNGAR